jgi:hypothetical protein
MKSLIKVYSLFLPLFFTVTSHARPFYYRPFLCETGYKADSYGRGLEAGFKALSNLRPQKNDEVCYQRGVSDGERTSHADQVFNCPGDFDHGYTEGLKTSALSAGTVCWSTVYSAGQAALRVGAREGNEALVGERCLREYAKGLLDGSGNKGYVSIHDEPEATCYGTGYWDGESHP